LNRLAPVVGTTRFTNVSGTNFQPDSNTAELTFAVRFASAAPVAGARTQKGLAP